MLKLYAFHWDFGRMGDVDGLFVADEKTVADTIGKDLYFGEILGKHSEIEGVLEVEDLTVKSEDQVFIAQLVSVIGSQNISGYNPLEYINEDEDEDSDEGDEG